MSDLGDKGINALTTDEVQEVIDNERDANDLNITKCDEVISAEGRFKF